MTLRFESAESAALLARTRALAPLILSVRDEIEAQRRLPISLVRAMAEAGLFHLMTPRAFGGLEADPLTFLSVVEELGRADGSCAWLLITNNGGVCTASVEESVGRAIYAADPMVVIGGTMVPSGRAVAVAGGYRVNGRWAFASGIEHCGWLAAGCVTMDGDQPRQDTQGQPELRAVLVPRAELAILDTWSVGGLRGTGSHDVVMQDVFVPAERSYAVADPPRRDELLYAIPYRSLGASGFAAATLGIARGAIDELLRLAATQVPTRSKTLLRERSMTQVSLARAEALVRAARAFLFEAMGDAWRTVLEGGAPSEEQLALIRLAATHASGSAAQAVDLIYAVAGGTALYTRNPLERAFRDVHAANLHFTIQPVIYETVGRAMLGLSLDDAPPL